MHSASRVLFEQMDMDGFKVPQIKTPQDVLVDVPVPKVNGGGYRSKVRLAAGHSPLDWQELVSTRGKAGRLVTGVDKIRSDARSLERFRKLNNPQSLQQLERGVPTFAIRPPLRVSREELARHRSPEDCWTVINGKVYSISAYMDFHPGGAKILMEKSAGQDSTVLFNRYHRWISVEKMLETCLVGVYAG